MQDSRFMGPTAFLFGAITPNDTKQKTALHQRTFKKFSDGEAFYYKKEGSLYWSPTDDQQSTAGQFKQKSKVTHPF